MNRLKIFNFTHFSPRLPHTIGQHCVENVRTLKMKKTGSGYEKEKFWENFLSRTEEGNKNVWKLTKFPIKHSSWTSGSKAENPDQKIAAKSLIFSPKRFQSAKNLTINNYPTRGFQIHQSALFFIGNGLIFSAFLPNVIGLFFAEMKKCFNHGRDLLDYVQTGSGICWIWIAQFTLIW